MKTRRTKEQIRKDNYNREVDAYNFYVVNLDTMRAETGFEFKEDAVDVLNDYDNKKKYKVVSKKALKSLGVENPNESFKYEAGGDFQSGVYAGGGKVKPFMYKEKNSSIMINGTKTDVKKMYLDYKNNFLSVSKFAEYYNISETQANSIINEGRKYAKEDGYYAGGGSFEKVKWQDVEVGDSARVKEINKMGVILKTYGRKFHLKFPNGTEKTFDASELEFIKNDNDKYADGGGIEDAIKGYKQYTKKNWEGYDYFSEKYAVNELAELELDLRKLNDGRLAPRKVVGGGYKNAKKVAQEWLQSQIDKQKLAIKTNGLSNYTNHRNFRGYLVNAKRENIISERKFNELLDESNEIMDSLPKSFAGGGEFMTDPTFGNFQNNVYANGGVTENYVSRRNLNTITIKKGNQKLTYKISDVLNGAYKLESGAKLEDIAFYVPKRSIVKVQLKTGKDFKPANGYWIKDGAKPIHVTKFDDGGYLNGINPYVDVNLIRERYELLNDMYYNEESNVDYTDILKVGDIVFGDGIDDYARIEKEINDPEKGDYFIFQDRYNNKFAFYVIQSVRDLHSKILFIQNVGISEKNFLYSPELINVYNNLNFAKGRIKLYEKNPNDANNYHGINYNDYSSASSQIKPLEENLRLMLQQESKKFNDGGVMSKLLTRKKDQLKVETTNEDIDLKEDSRIRVRPSSFVRKDKEGDWMMKNNSSKEARSYAGGGKVTFKEKAKAIAKNFEGKRVEPKYQKEYGKVYDKTEAKEVGNKIAGSQKASYDAKLEKGSEVKKGKGNHKMKEVTELAKKIRKDGEKWTDALRRAYQQMK